MKESTVERKLRQGVENRKGMCIKLVTISGLPDRLVLLPGKRIYFVELKRPEGGRISERQGLLMTKLHALGFFSCVASTLEEVDSFLARADAQTKAQR